MFLFTGVFCGSFGDAASILCSFDSEEACDIWNYASPFLVSNLSLVRDLLAHIDDANDSELMADHGKYCHFDL